MSKQQALTEKLSQEFTDGIHALALHTFTLPEWQVRNGRIPQSANCLGGGYR